MARIRSRSRNRAGFTLIEMVIVLGIILLLAALFLGAVMKVMGMAPEVQTRTEISELEVALKAFMSDYGLDKPPPSLLMLKEDMAYNTANPLDLQSVTFLKKMFGKNLNATGTGIDWNGDGQIVAGPTGWYTLEGEMALVFYLSGIPNNWERTNLGADLRGLGFSVNNNNPAADTGLAVAHMGAGNRKGTYYTFPANRLVTASTYSTATSSLSPFFYVFVDPWKSRIGGPKPYAFFSSGGANNLYNPYKAAGITDCLTIGANAWYTAAVAGVPSAYENPNTYQILSAGRDGTFGDGNYIGGTTGTGPGHDDQANFSSRILGANQQ